MLRLKNVGVEIAGADGQIISPVRNVSLKAHAGQITAIVGESGSGKTLSALAIMRLLPRAGMRVAAGSCIEFKGMDLLGLSENEMRRLRGSEMAMVYQDPSACLNPVLTVGRQIIELLIQHLELTKGQAWSRAGELLRDVGIDSPSGRLKAYPHELSGGQQQRVMIAMAIACQPELLIADEPTSALDVTIQRQIMDLIIRIKEERNLGVLFITHDLAVASDIADRVVVMRQGEVVEEGDSHAVLYAPKHPYTQSLIEARLRLDRKSPFRRKSMEQKSSGPRLKARGLSKNYTIPSGFWRRDEVGVVKDVSFELYEGETLGIVGESGSGKTTLAMLLMRLIEATDGTIFIDGKAIHDIRQSTFRPMRRWIQMIFQNPYASLNPRWTIYRTLMAPMKLYGLAEDAAEMKQKVICLLEAVGLSREALYKYPQQFSGGERQRIAIARCIAVEPDILICDECVSALDVSMQVQILDLLIELQKKSGLSLIFVSHDLATVQYIADRVLVFHKGVIVESAMTEELFASPKHAYTRQLLAATPVMGGSM